MNLKTLAAVSALTLASCLPSSAIVLVSENFNSVATGTLGTGSSVGAFTVTGGNIDVVGPGFYGELCTGATTVNCVDLTGTTAGTLATSTLNLTPDTYTLSFTLNGSQRGEASSTTVSLGAFYSETFNLASGATNSIVRNFVVAAPATATLTFASNTPGFAGSILDNVTLANTAVAPIPEPASVFLGLTGLATLFALRRRS